MNILIKLTCLIGLVIAPLLSEGHGTCTHNPDYEVEVVADIKDETNNETNQATEIVVEENDETQTDEDEGNDADDHEGEDHNHTSDEH